VERLEVKGGTMSTVGNTLTVYWGDLWWTRLGSRAAAISPWSSRDPKPRRRTRPADTMSRRDYRRLLLGLSRGYRSTTSIQQLGLRLVGQRLPLNVLVVDSADKVPIEN
jgi:hypothetical protein